MILAILATIVNYGRKVQWKLKSTFTIVALAKDVVEPFRLTRPFKSHCDTQHNDIHPNDIHPNDIQPNDTQHNI